MLNNELRLLKARLRRHFDRQPGHYWAIDPGNGAVIAVSDAMLYSVARTRADVIQKPWVDAFAGVLGEAAIATLQASIERVKQTLDTDVLPVVQYPARVASGQHETLKLRSWSLSNAPFLDEFGKVIAIIHRALDVSELVSGAAVIAGADIATIEVSPIAGLQQMIENLHHLRLRDTLQKQIENRSTLVVVSQMATIGTWSMDIATQTVVWSREMRAMFEMPMEMRPSLYFAERRFEGPDRAAIVAAFARCVTDGIPFDLELRAATISGKRLWVRATGNVDRNAAGDIVQAFGGIENISERYRAFDRMKASERRLDFALDAAEIGEWHYNSETGLIETSPIHDHYYGFFYPRKDWTFLALSERIHFDDIKMVRQIYRESENNNGLFDVEYRVVWPDATIHWLWAKGRLKRDTKGDIVRASGIVVDVTDRRRSDEQRRLLEIAARHANDVVLITDTGAKNDPGQRIVFVNDAFERQTGYTRAEVMGKSPRMLQGPLTSRQELDRVSQAVTRLEPVRAELLNYTKAGDPYYIELDIVPVIDSTGGPSYFIAIQRDVSERRARDAKIVEQAALIDEVSDGIVQHSMDGEVLTWNRGAERIFGLQAADVIGRHILDVSPTDRDRFDAGMATVQASGTYVGEFSRLAHDGRLLDIEERWSLIRNNDGSPKSVLVIKSDVTARRRLETQLQQSQRLESIGKLTGGVAHDFNNLLTVVLGNSEALSQSLHDQPDLKLLAEMVRQAAQRGAALTGRLLSFARRRRLNPDIVDINVMIDENYDLLRTAVGETVQLKRKLAPLLGHAVIDPSELQEALLNICLNARDAMPGGGVITIETANAEFDDKNGAWGLATIPNRYVLIAVTDTGCGIAAENLPHVFDPFFTTKEFGKGTGLGLSMVYGLVKQSGGHVKIHSEPGLGTILRLFLPAADTEAAQPEAVLDTTAMQHGDEHILLVEDDELVRRYVEGQLIRLGYRVTIAENGKVAIDLLNQQLDCDLLFTDIVMPGGLDGREVAAAALCRNPGLKVLFTSGYTGIPIESVDTNDVDGHVLKKPYHHLELARKIRMVLDQ